MKFDLRKPPAAFKIKETDSIEKIDKMQIELKEMIERLETLHAEIQKFRDEKERLSRF